MLTQGRVPLMAELSSPIPNASWPVFSQIPRGQNFRVSRKLDKQSLLPKKELRLLTDLRLLPPAPPIVELARLIASLTAICHSDLPNATGRQKW